MACHKIVAKLVAVKQEAAGLIMSSESTTVVIVLSSKV